MHALKCIVQTIPRPGRQRRVRKSAFAEQKALPMDVEHINAIGNALADLTKRTESLRGYL
jgi:hypothetical protein